MARWLEIGMVCLVGVAPYLFVAIQSVLWQLSGSTPRNGHPIAEALFGSITSFGTIAVVLFVMWKSGRPWKEFGVVRPNMVQDVVSGIGVAIGIFLLSMIAGRLTNLLEVLPGVSEGFHAFGESQVPQRLQGLNTAGGLAVFGASVAVITASEEFVTRAYLMPRLNTALGSTWRAALVAAALNASYHIYQGARATLIIFATEIVINLAFWRGRRIWPFVVGHALYDFYVFAASTSHS